MNYYLARRGLNERASCLGSYRSTGVTPALTKREYSLKLEPPNHSAIFTPTDEETSVMLSSAVIEEIGCPSTRRLQLASEVP